MGRLVTGFILAAGWILLLFAGPYALFCLVIILGGEVALLEFLRMSQMEGEQKHTRLILAIGIIPLVAASLWGSPGLDFSIFLSLLLLTILTLAAYPSLDNGLHFIARHWFGIFYIGFCSAHLILLRSLPQGIYWLLMLTAVTVFSDTGAYYVGRSLGRAKLYPALSPGKTRAGAVGGIIGGMLGGLLVATVFLQDVSYAMMVLLTLVLSGVGIIGDLTESLIKRASGIKDSGQILPGHGGLLDRCDSLLLTAPVLYYVLYWGHAVLFN